MLRPKLEMLGCMLYVLLITLFFYRFTFINFGQRNSTGPTGSIWEPLHHEPCRRAIDPCGAGLGLR
jgi:hypothetical protein